VLQSVTVCCRENVYLDFACRGGCGDVAVYCNVLQSIAVCCSENVYLDFVRRSGC